MNDRVQGILDSGTPGFLLFLALALFMTDRRPLRQSLRKLRRSLSQAQQRHAAQRLLIRAARHTIFRQARRVAFYWPSDGEISPLPLLRLALAQGKACYLPVIGRNSDQNRMTLVRYRAGTPLKKNGYGIPEPHSKRKNEQLSFEQLDLVFLPLVGFDRKGNRLGMGGGFYDRALERTTKRQHSLSLFGLAHSLQEVPSLQQQHWDIPLHAVITEDRVLTTKKFFTRGLEKTRREVPRRAARTSGTNSR